MYFLKPPVNLHWHLAHPAASRPPSKKPAVNSGIKKSFKYTVDSDFFIISYFPLINLTLDSILALLRLRSKKRRQAVS
ncbi:MAG: hypothetical protein ACI9V1_001945 [Spirosomataceae bacterium]|jgi:hypothetical protein